jgi:putative transposase
VVPDVPAPNRRRAGGPPAKRGAGGIADERGWQIVAKAVLPDHTNLFVRVGPTVCCAGAYRRGIARVLGREFPRPHSHAMALWSPSYFAASDRYVSESTVRRDIEHRWKAVMGP